MNALETIFPGLANKNYQITSPKDDVYNCIAWAAGDTSIWWWPDKAGEAFWPSNVAREITIDAFRALFSTLGFDDCGDTDYEAGIEKDALFAVGSLPKHASRQLPNGRWTSKFGVMEDIEHDLRDIEGSVYGSVVLIMKRALTTA